MAADFFKRILNVLDDYNFEITESYTNLEGYPENYMKQKITHKIGTGTISFDLIHDGTRQGFYKAFSDAYTSNILWKLFVEIINDMQIVGTFTALDVVKDLVKYIEQAQIDMAFVDTELLILYGEKGVLNNEE